MIEPTRKAESETGSSDDVVHQPAARISANKLKALIRSKIKNGEDVAELTGTIGSEIKQAVEKQHLNKKMFGWVVQLAAMSDEKLADHLDDLEHYLDISGLNDRADKATKRMEFGDADADDDEAEGKGKKGGKGAANVKPFPKPKGETNE